MTIVTRQNEPNTNQANEVQRLIGVYNADGTVRGELAYWIGARLGRAHCSLCDITHGLVRERSDWKDCRARLAVPFDVYHLNDQPDSVRDLKSPAPMVVAETAERVIALLGPEELTACNGSPERLITEIERAVDAAGLSLP